MRKLLLFFILVYQFSIGQTILNEIKANELKNNIIKSSSETKNIISEFVQYKHLNFLEKDIISKGNLIYIEPNYIKWEYNYPFDYECIFEKEKLTIINEGQSNQIDISSNSLFKEINKLIANTLKGNMFNEEKFDIQYYENNRNYLIKFILKEKNLMKYFYAFHLLFDKNKYDVIEIKIIENKDDFTKIVLLNKKINNNVK
tara:strand:- start:5 stop:607 length:603 start_codon:yes stop_codon:yes gene_type:complete